MTKTNFEQWIEDTTKSLLGTMREDCEPDWEADPDAPLEVRELREGARATYNEAWDLLELRISIGLVQARAMECRQMAGQITMNREAFTAGAPQDLQLPLRLSLQDVSRYFIARASKLEDMGLAMAKKKVESLVEPDAGMLVQ